MAEVINNTIVISDLHCGCRIGLCHPDGAELDGGGTYKPSKFQLKMWSMWREFWHEWVPRVCRGEPFDVVVNGDAIDGSHHGTTTQWSHDSEDQAEAAYQILAPIAEKAARFYMVRGTEAHVGQSGVEEERLAKRLGAVKDKEGRYARWELWKYIGGRKGALAHIMHHIGTTGRAAYETSGPQAELIAEFVESARKRKRPPDFVIRSHRHRFIRATNPTDAGDAIVAVTPGWQGKTPFVYKIAARVMEPQFGGLLLRQGDEEHFLRHRYWSDGSPESRGVTWRRSRSMNGKTSWRA